MLYFNQPGQPTCMRLQGWFLCPGCFWRLMLHIALLAPPRLFCPASSWWRPPRLGREYHVMFGLALSTCLAGLTLLNQATCSRSPLLLVDSKAWLSSRFTMDSFTSLCWLNLYRALPYIWCFLEIRCLKPTCRMCQTSTMSIFRRLGKNKEKLKLVHVPEVFKCLNISVLKTSLCLDFCSLRT